MDKFIDVKGSSIEDAEIKALEILNKKREDVSVEIIKKGKQGFFGIGYSQTVIRVYYSDTITDTIINFLSGILTRMNTNSQIEILENSTETEIYLNIKGDNLGTVIGKRGDNLDALQCILIMFANKLSEQLIKVYLDCENYRERRKETLIKLAHKMAGKAIRLRKNIKLEPMNSFERKIIHAALTDEHNVYTYSSGSEPSRRVVIAFGKRRDKK